MCRAADAEGQAAALRSQLEAATAAQQRLAHIEGALQTFCACKMVGLIMGVLLLASKAKVPVALQGWPRRR